MSRHLVFFLIILVGLLGCEKERSPDNGELGRVDLSGTRLLLSQIFGGDVSEAGPDIFYGHHQTSVRQKSSAPKVPALVGIVLQGGKPAAFFVDAGRSFTGKEGDRIAEHYQIVRIEPDYVVLEDLSTGKSYRVGLTRS